MYLWQPDTAKFANLTKVILRSKTPAVESAFPSQLCQVKHLCKEQIKLVELLDAFAKQHTYTLWLTSACEVFLRWKQMNHLFFVQHPKIKITSLILLSIVTALSGEKASR